MVDKLSIAGSKSFSYDANIGIGANLDWHLTHPETGQGSRWDVTLPLGGYENFILTEAVPLENHLLFSNTYRNTDSLCRFANEHNPGIQYYIYETWHCTNSGNGSTAGSGGYPCDWDPNSNTPWRERIDVELAKWESIADSINASDLNPMLVIPGGQALGRLDDTISSGAVPDLTSVFDLFDDEYHLDLRGNYFIACVMYAVIHGESPVGLPNQLADRFGSLYLEYPTAELAAIMQKVAWQTVCDYERDGVDCETATSTSSTQEHIGVKVFPVPSTDFITIEYDAVVRALPFSIVNQVGKVVLQGTSSLKSWAVDVSALPAGMYFISINNEIVKFVK